MNKQRDEELEWGRAARVFHWVNVVLVLMLIVLGMAILNAGSFGVSGDGKVLLKTLHVYVGYAFALNLAWRLVWAFVGHPRARWSALLPGYRGYTADLKQYIREFRQGDIREQRGHNPLGRIMVTVLLILMTTQAVTGLVLAGTDLYMPPFGQAMAEWVTDGDPERLANLRPGSREHVVTSSWDEMRAFRQAWIDIHLVVFYVFSAAILLHIAGVVVAEFKEGRSLISTMVTGRRPGSR